MAIDMDLWKQPATKGELASALVSVAGALIAASDVMRISVSGDKSDTLKALNILIERISALHEEYDELVGEKNER